QRGPAADNFAAPEALFLGRLHYDAVRGSVRGGVRLISLPLKFVCGPHELASAARFNSPEGSPVFGLYVILTQSVASSNENGEIHDNKSKTDDGSRQCRSPADNTSAGSRNDCKGQRVGGGRARRPGN